MGARSIQVVKRTIAGGGWLPLATILLVAVVLYSYRIGRPSLGASEAWSLVAAEAPDSTGTVRAALQYDPGKPPLYQLVLHFFCREFGTSEVTVRILSTVFGLCSIALLYALAARMFGPRAAPLAATLWAFCPVAIVLARWARMYSGFIALVLLMMLALWLARENPKRGRLAGLALSTAAMLYIHMAALFYLAAAVLICARDLWLRRRQAWRVPIALLCGVLLFAPFVGVEIRQAHALLKGHWLDWAGKPAAFEPIKLILAAILGVVTTGCAIGGQVKRTNPLEALRFCALWGAIPVVFVIGISLAARPAFELRYLAPSIPAAILLVALACLEARPMVRGVILGATFGVWVAGLGGVYAATPDTWKNVAAEVATEPSFPVFFERGFVVVASESSSDNASEFPEGYYRAVFDYYYRRGAPRLVIDSGRPDEARAAISNSASPGRGAWLISGKPPGVVRSELPNGALWQTTHRDYEAHVTLWRVRLLPAK